MISRAQVLDAVSLREFIGPSAVTATLRGNDVQDVVAQMMELLQQSGAFSDEIAAEVHDAMLERERFGTTAVGGGIAIPHGKHDGVREVSIAIGVSREGIDFNSLDGKPVHVVMATVSPTYEAATYLQLLQSASFVLGDRMTVQRLKQATSPEEILELISETESR